MPSISETKAFVEGIALKSIKDFKKAKHAFKVPFNERQVFFKAIYQECQQGFGYGP
ncbi:hypothetical protein [Oceanobacillus jeddahense]|uniref:hypothetical protein n=1 Tax=Oceanobacillus jeddahense TaxID=1462527 RepID=UPI0012EE6BE7|nr:hypothetical protein [Oceanobacillus jeddahense]